MKIADLAIALVKAREGNCAGWELEYRALRDAVLLLNTESPGISGETYSRLLRQEPAVAAAYSAIVTECFRLKELLKSDV